MRACWSFWDIICHFSFFFIRSLRACSFCAAFSSCLRILFKASDHLKELLQINSWFLSLKSSLIKNIFYLIVFWLYSSIFFGIWKIIECFGLILYLNDFVFIFCSPYYRFGLHGLIHVLCPSRCLCAHSYRISNPGYCDPGEWSFKNIRLNSSISNFRVLVSSQRGRKSTKSNNLRSSGERRKDRIK